jgi:glutathione S-transferase
MFPNLTAINPEAFKLYAICSALLALNVLVLAGMTGGARGKNKSPANPEDAGKPKETEYGPNHPAVERVQRAHRNALENIGVFWPIALIFVLCGASPLGAKAYFITFTAARFLHSFFHLRGIQPFRTIAFAIGALCLGGMIVQIFMAAFSA